MVTYDAEDRPSVCELQVILNKHKLNIKSTEYKIGPWQIILIALFFFLKGKKLYQIGETDNSWRYTYGGEASWTYLCQLLLLSP